MIKDRSCGRVRERVYRRGAVPTNKEVGLQEKDT